jgi:hypothetical protein
MLLHSLENASPLPAAVETALVRALRCLGSATAQKQITCGYRRLRANAVKDDKRLGSLLLRPSLSRLSLDE